MNANKISAILHSLKLGLIILSALSMMVLFRIYFFDFEEWTFESGSRTLVCTYFNTTIIKFDSDDDGDYEGEYRFDTFDHTFNSHGIRFKRIKEDRNNDGIFDFVADVEYLTNGGNKIMARDEGKNNVIEGQAAEAILDNLLLDGVNTSPDIQLKIACW